MRTGTFLAILLVTFSAARPAEACYCDDGSNGLFGCCGRAGQRICDTVFSSCNACADGYSWDNGYTSYVGTALCQPDWPGSPSVPSDGYDYTFTVVTDQHIGDPERSKCYPDSAYKVGTAQINNLFMSRWPDGFENAGLPFGDPIAVVGTGDITEHGTDSPETSMISEMTRYRDYWDAKRTDDSIRFPVYVGLGNHDVVESGTCISGETWCEARSISKNNISNGYLKLRMKKARGVNFDSDTSNYSWDWGPVHLIQGNVEVGKQDGFAWLKKDLADNVGSSGRPIMMFQHYGSDSDPDTEFHSAEREDFKRAIAGYNVVALFTGHTHRARFRPGHICSGNAILACREDSDCGHAGTCQVNPDSLGVDEFTGDTGGMMQDCGDNTDPIVGEGSFFVVHVRDTNDGKLKLEVVRMKWREATPLMVADTHFNGRFNGFASDPVYTRTVWARNPSPVAVCAHAELTADSTCHAVAGSLDAGSYSPDGTAVSCEAMQAGPYPVGVTQVAVYCQGSGGISFCTAPVEVVDRSPPVLTCPATTLECADKGAIANYAPTVFENCGTPSVQCSVPPGTKLSVGAHPVYCKATDAAQNTGGCDGGQILVQDTLKPMLICPPPVTMECTGNREVTGGVVANAADVCDGALTPVCSSGPGSVFPLGITAVQCGAKDHAGNSESCSTQVTVVDTQPPVLATLTPSLTQISPADGRMVDVTVTPSVSDLCDPTVKCKVTSVVNSSGTNTAKITAPLAVQLQATPNLSYAISVVCVDGSQNAARATVKVTVSK